MNGNNDMQYRDTQMKAYVCAVVDLQIDEFDNGIKAILNQDSEKEAFIEMMKQDLESRLYRILNDEA